MWYEFRVQFCEGIERSSTKAIYKAFLKVTMSAYGCETLELRKREWAKFLVLDLWNRSIQTGKLERVRTHILQNIILYAQTRILRQEMGYRHPNK